MNRLMNREDVYKVIDTERDFQDKHSGDLGRPDMLVQMSMGDLLGAIKVNVDKAYAAWYRDHGTYPNTTEFLRKVAALCVKSGEQFGMPHRLEE